MPAINAEIAVDDPHDHALLNQFSQNSS